MKTTVILALALAATIGTARVSAEPLRMGVEAAYPPFNFIDDKGNVAGFDVDIGNALCGKMKRACTWVSQEWAGIIPALQAKKFDVIMSSMTITDKRKEEVSFTKPYYFTYGLMIANKGASLKLAADALAGKSIGVGAGSSHEVWAEAHLNGATLVPYKSTDDMFLDFQNGRVDAVFADAVAVIPWMESNGGRDAFDTVGEVHDKSLGTDIGIAVRKDDTELQAALEKALDEIIADGTFEKLNKKYLSFNLR
ncbi:hypothetical protein N185_16230 [Sinorhizobium sp. GW3]|nr:hypothetical protein N185_16230 [Sinorhizobium sp. GW3]